MRPGWVRDGAILLGIGLGVAALVAAAVFDNCLGSETCFAATGGLNVGGLLGF
jgi:hypothetical protein